MEISHRAKDFQPVVDEAVALFKELLNIPEGYSVLFLGGGASMEFCMVPYNFLEKKAAYLNTGTWAKKALKEAKAFGENSRGGFLLKKKATLISRKIMKCRPTWIIPYHDQQYHLRYGIACRPGCQCADGGRYVFGHFSLVR